jgi:hypothetical protein
MQRDKPPAKFWLQPIDLASATGFSARALRKLERLVVENQEPWMEAWNEFFGGRNSPESS